MNSSCQHCDTDLVWVEPATVLASQKALKPNFKTLGALKNVGGQKLHLICPSCDAYALGAELDEGFPVITQKEIPNV